jgi:cholesterol 7alpha-monooxygenase
MNFGTLVTGASALLVVLVCLSLRRYSALRKAPVVHYWIPWIGSAFEIRRDPDGFFRRAMYVLYHISDVDICLWTRIIMVDSEKYGPMFTVNAFGRTVTYVTTPLVSILLWIVICLLTECFAADRRGVSKPTGMLT